MPVARPIAIVSAEKFAGDLKNDTVYFGCIKVTMKGQYCAAYGTEYQGVRIGDECSERLLDEIEAFLYSDFMEPANPV